MVVLHNHASTGLVPPPGVDLWRASGILQQRRPTQEDSLEQGRASTCKDLRMQLQHSTRGPRGGAERQIRVMQRHGESVCWGGTWGVSGWALVTPCTGGAINTCYCKTRHDCTTPTHGTSWYVEGHEQIYTGTCSIETCYYNCHTWSQVV